MKLFICIHFHIAIIGGSGIYDDLCLDVMQIVLVKREYVSKISIHRICSTPPISDHKKIAHRAAVQGLNCSITGYFAEYIQEASAMNDNIT